MASLIKDLEIRSQRKHQKTLSVYLAMISRDLFEHAKDVNIDKGHKAAAIVRWLNAISISPSILLKTTYLELKSE